MHTHMHACRCADSSLICKTFLSQKDFESSKSTFANYLTIYLMRSCHWWFFLGSYSQLLFSPFQLHSGGNFIIIIDYGTPSRKSPEHLQHKDTVISSQTHAHPHYKYLHYWWWISKTSVCRGEEMGFHHLPRCQNREEEVGVWDVWHSCAG